MATQTRTDDFNMTSVQSGCSPLTELYNPTTGQDRIFFSIGNSGTNASNVPACAVHGVGCMLSLDVTGTTWPPALANFDGYEVPSVTTGNGVATSGIVVDNVGGSTTVPQTTVNGGATGTGLSITVASTSAFRSNEYIQIDWEIMKVGTITTSTTLPVSRAQLGTANVSHANGTAVVGVRVTNLTQTLTNSAAATSAVVEASDMFNVNDYIQIDSEAMLITGIPDSTHLTVTRQLLGTSLGSHTASQVNDLGRYVQSASIYFSFFGNSNGTQSCNAQSGVGCAVKLTQAGLK